MAHSQFCVTHRSRCARERRGTGWAYPRSRRSSDSELVLRLVRTLGIYAGASYHCPCFSRQKIRRFPNGSAMDMSRPQGCSVTPGLAFLYCFCNSSLWYPSISSTSILSAAPGCSRRGVRKCGERSHPWKPACRAAYLIRTDVPNRF
jgi:hypothetical protein